MKTSKAWLQTYFEKPLPETETLSDALTFHVFEIEETEEKDGDVMIDVKVLPDRASYAMSHRGIAHEISAILDVPMMRDPLTEELPEFPTTDELSITIEDESSCLRYVGAIVRGVKIGPSPKWLKDALESIGQRSINNVVDATNYVMLDMGQPLHTFDAHKLMQKDGSYAIRVRGSYEEKITTLTGEEFILPDGTLLIADANSDTPIGIAGVKGGQSAAITNDTTDLIVESANFDGTLVRKTSQRLKLWTDASQRFQNRPSPELAAYGMRDVLKLITDIAGGEVVGGVDIFPENTKREIRERAQPVSVTLSKINTVLGSTFSLEDVENVFDRLGFSYSVLDDIFRVVPPFERRDIVIPEDLIEEVGRIIGYETIEPVSLPQLSIKVDQNKYKGIERVKDFMIGHGYTEISTQSFAVEGDVYLANPLDQSRPALRTTLVNNMKDALARAVNVAPRVLGPTEALKLFEMGTIFTDEGESLALVFGYPRAKGQLEQIAEDLKEQFSIETTQATPDIYEAVLGELGLVSYGEGYEPRKISLGSYTPFSIYPAALRDIAVWTPEKTEEDEVANIILKEAGELLARIDLFDRFSKPVGRVERISYAFRLVFESFERTLSDEDLNPLMQKITDALNAKEEWEVR